jgi:hypothetical protein
VPKRRRTSSENTVILHFSYEELRALRAGADVFLEGESGATGVVLAPSESRACVEALQPLLQGDLSLSTLEELWGVQTAVTAIVECLRAEMEAVVVAMHAADEGAVAAYFDFAHALIVSRRISELAGEMAALIELVTGSAPTSETAHDFQFPD